jgi:hypothetical protein
MDANLVMSAFEGDLAALRDLVRSVRRSDSRGDLRWLLELLWRQRAPEAILADTNVMFAVDLRYSWWCHHTEYHLFEANKPTPATSGYASSRCSISLDLSRRECTGPFKFEDMPEDASLCRICLGNISREFVEPKPELLRNMRAKSPSWAISDGFRDEIRLDPKTEWIQMEIKR